MGGAPRDTTQARRISGRCTTRRFVRFMTQPSVSTPATDRGFFGHPGGLSTLFFTEMWERFSYYGMRGFLILYMTKALLFTDQHAGLAYGNYVFSVWFTPIIGGVIVDRWFGKDRRGRVGGSIIAPGRLTPAVHPPPV